MLPLASLNRAELPATTRQSSRCSRMAARTADQRRSFSLRGSWGNFFWSTNDRNRPLILGLGGAAVLILISPSRAGATRAVGISDWHHRRTGTRCQTAAGGSGQAQDRSAGIRAARYFALQVRELFGR